jgi:predicted nucleic acid-binding Zn ribbon protein
VPWEPLPDPYGSRPARLSATLDRVLAGLGSPPASTLDVVERAWDDLVGPAAAEALRPVAIRDGVLHVRATDPTWQGQARWLEATVVEGLAPLLGDGVVTSLSARLDRGRDRR